MGMTSAWTQTDSSNTMIGIAHPSSCQGAGHAIVATASLLVCLLCRHQRRSRPTLGAAADSAAGRRPLLQGTTYRHLLVPCRRHHQRFSPSLQRPLGLRPARRGLGLSSALPRPQAADASACWRSSAVCYRRYPHCPLQTQGAGSGHPSQPHAGTGRREVRLWPHLGHAGLAGSAPGLGYLGLALACPSLRPRQGRPQTGQALSVDLSHQRTGAGWPTSAPTRR